MAVRWGGGVAVLLLLLVAFEFGIGLHLEVIEDNQDVQYLNRADLRRQKREWIVPPVNVRENEDYSTKEYIAKIRSDEEERTDIIYSLTGGGASEPPYGIFVVDKVNGNLRMTKRVDREEYPVFHLRGHARDSNNKEVEKPLELRIKIIDVNDNKPEFIQEVFVGSVEELSEPNTHIMRLNATDADEEGTLNTKIAYKILSQVPEDVGVFMIGKGTGDIFTVRAILDREKSAFYELEVEARDLDGAYNGLTDKAIVKIKVLDVNDNRPKLEKETYEGSIEENAVDVEVLRMKALDDDEENTDNWLADFEIVSGNEENYFIIETDEKTNEGVLKVVKGVNYETLQNLQLGVIVRNKAPYHKSVPKRDEKPTPIKINVKNVKEGPAFKPETKKIVIKEGMSAVDLKKVIATYPARDGDTGEVAEKVRYAKGYDPDNWISIDQNTAEIKLVKIPDRESPFLTGGVYTAKILALTEDHPAKTVTGTILLNVEDVNDHCPTIVNMAPHMCKNAGRINVTAVDEDADPNAGPFTFHIVDEPKGNADKWEINKTHDTSVLIVPKKTLWGNFYEIQVDVKDRQGLSCSEKQILKVEICRCPDGINCVALRISDEKNAELGGGAIGLMILGLLMLLLVPLLLLFCQCGKASGFTPIAAFDNGAGALNTLCHEAEPVDTHKLLLPIHYGAGSSSVGGVNCGEDGRGGGGRGKRGGNSHDEVILGKVAGYGPTVLGTSISGSRYMVGHGTSIAGQPGHLEVGGMGEGGILTEAFWSLYLTQKAQNYTEEEDSQPANDCFLVYNYEETHSQGSVGCCSLIEGDQDDHFLNDLGSKFKTLAEICVGKEINMDVQASHSSSTVQSSGMAVNPVISKNIVVTSPALQVTQTVQGPKIQQKIEVTERSCIPDSGAQAVKPPANSVVKENVVVSKQSYSPDSGAKVVRLPADAVFQNSCIVTEKLSASGPALQVTRPPADAVVQNKYVVTEKSFNSGGLQAGTRSIAGPLYQQNSMVNGRISTTGSGLHGTIKVPELLGSKNIVVTERKVVSGSGMEGAILRSDPLLTQNFFATEQLLTPSLPLNSTTSRVTKYSTVQYSE
ncbi:desmoglein-2-like [Latimeria chalumnae]|uniref:desmoglein-2-like n=1 Tax=Latimeria chalumnae TaxID=7897 RepID=UPI0006D8D96E|nr:PREDICTED: desmoglein-2-like isoform X1 [Latimeria chalumnae]|eukprot:XP_014353651.1 PREDICTED: desmoglein-2-like isoform X1 [Latimeria chalumnae]